jgi:glycosyltransferase involved in cell wall biosynthesis
MGERIKVLLSAYACEPGKGSEPYQGWMWANSLAQHCDVTVLTRANNRAPIEAALPGTAGRSPSFIYYDPPPLWLRLKKMGLPISIFYLIWQIGARMAANTRLPSFDIVHHVTFCSFALPGFWWSKHPAVILGPLGGGMVAPRSLLPVFGRNKYREIFRSIVVCLATCNPLLRRSLDRARAILAANEETALRIPGKFRSKVIRMIEVGVNPARGTSTTSARRSDEFRLIWVGGFYPRKAAILAVEALAMALRDNPLIKLDFVGDGEEVSRVKQRASALGINPAIAWHGHLAHDETLRKIASADAFIFTSARDTAGNAVLEAMAAGLPSIVVCHQGAAEMTAAETAIRVAPDDPEKVAENLAQGILTLSRDPDLRARMGEAARQRVLEHFTWEKKAEAMMEIYRRALGQTAA